MKKKSETKSQSAFGRMGKRVSRKRELGILDDLNKKRKLFSSVPCTKDLVHKEKEGENEIEKIVLKEGKEYMIFDSGLNLGDGKKYYGIANSSKSDSIPGTLFFETHEIEEYFDLEKITAAGYTLQDASPLDGISYDVNKLKDMEE